jgi:hypothetical protein
MLRKLRAVVVVIGTIATFAPSDASAGDCCHLCRRRCVVCCCCGGGSGGEAASSKGGDEERTFFRRAAPPVQAQVVPMMPMFAMPMMPMMAGNFQMAGAGASTKGPEESDRCNRRIDDLEKDVNELAKSIQNLQVVVSGQTELIKSMIQAKQ